MLQWMGGARRKVTSISLMWQKQYFEQRRRQEQEADRRNDSEAQNTYGQHAENNRSLDILSLLNLSTVAQKNKSKYPLGRNDSEHDAPNYQVLKCPQLIQSFQTNEVTPSGPSEVEEGRYSSSYQPGNAYPKTMLVNTLGKDAAALNSDNDKMNQLKMVPDYQELCMMDILGDDEPNLPSERSLEHEAHAAFSIEGLGKVEMETPVHPPEDAMMPEVDVPLYKSSVEHFFCPKNILGSFSKPKQEFTKEFSLFDDKGSSFTDVLGNDVPSYHNREKNRHIWDATSSSLSGAILDESVFGVSYNNWMDQPHASDDYYSMDCMKKEFIFQGSYRQKSRTTTRKSGKSGCIELPELYLKHQKSEKFQNFPISEITWRSPVQSDHDVGDVADQRTWSSFINFLTVRNHARPVQ